MMLVVSLAKSKTNTPLRMVGIHRDINQEKKDQERLKLAASVLNKQLKVFLF
jgi:hypothetical protein